MEADGGCLLRLIGLLGMMLPENTVQYDDYCVFRGQETSLQYGGRNLEANDATEEVGGTGLYRTVPFGPPS